MRKGEDPGPEPDPYICLMAPIRIREAQKHADPADPEPDLQHWLKGTLEGRVKGSNFFVILWPKKLPSQDPDSAAAKPGF